MVIYQNNVYTILSVMDIVCIRVVFIHDLEMTLKYQKILIGGMTTIVFGPLVYIRKKKGRKKRR